MTPTLISVWKTLLPHSNALTKSRDFRHLGLFGCEVGAFTEGWWNIHKDLANIKETGLIAKERALSRCLPRMFGWCHDDASVACNVMHDSAVGIISVLAESKTLETLHNVACSVLKITEHCCITGITEPQQINSEVQGGSLTLGITAPCWWGVITPPPASAAPRCHHRY